MEDVKVLFERYLNDYNQAWYSKDIDKLREFYDVEHNNVIYFAHHYSNHTPNSSFAVILVTFQNNISL